MIIEVNRRVLEQFVRDKEFMYQLVNNWLMETNEHYRWYGIGLHSKSKSLTIRPRGSTQISIKYYNHEADYTAEREIEKRIVKFKGKR